LLHAAPNASQVDRHHAIPLLTADLSRVDAALHDASVVERGVEPPERGHGPVNHGRHLGVIGDVAANGEGLAAAGTETLGGRTHRVLAPVCEHD